MRAAAKPEGVSQWEGNGMGEDVLGHLKTRQQIWARERGLKIDADGYCISCDANLFEPLSACSRRDIGAGDGSELGKGGARGKIQALHSSAALACNFFDYWRGRDLGVLARSLGISTRLCDMAFEQKFPTGLGGIAPNLDVVMFGCDGSLVAIESKFTEPFSKSKTKSILKPKYFPPDHGLWKDAGLSGCQTLAEDLRDGRIQFVALDAAQLLKHMLGLAFSGHPWSLMCLWYAPGEPFADVHSEELGVFSQALGVDSKRFSAMTYQTLFDRLVLGPEHSEYAAYLRCRYFGGQLSEISTAAQCCGVNKVSNGSSVTLEGVSKKFGDVIAL